MIKICVKNLINLVLQIQDVQVWKITKVNGCSGCWDQAEVRARERVSAPKFLSEPSKFWARFRLVSALRSSEMVHIEGYVDKAKMCLRGYRIFQFSKMCLYFLAGCLWLFKNNHCLWYIFWLSNIHGFWSTAYYFCNFSNWTLFSTNLHHSYILEYCYYHRNVHRHCIRVALCMLNPLLNLFLRYPDHLGA